MTKLTVTGKSKTKRQTLTKVIVSLNTLDESGNSLDLMYRYTTDRLQTQSASTTNIANIKNPQNWQAQ